MKKNIFNITSWAIIFMIIMLAIVYLNLLIIPEGRLYEVTKAMLPVLPSIILIVATMMYVKATFNLLRETKRDSIIRDLRVKLKNFYTPLYVNYYIQEDTPHPEEPLFKNLSTRGAEKGWYMYGPDKKGLWEIIGDDLHFADDELVDGLLEIYSSDEKNTLTKEKCDKVANLIKTGFNKYKNKYEKLSEKGEY